MGDLQLDLFFGINGHLPDAYCLILARGSDDFSTADRRAKDPTSDSSTDRHNLDRLGFGDRLLCCERQLVSPAHAQIMAKLPFHIFHQLFKFLTSAAFRSRVGLRSALFLFFQDYIDEPEV